MPPVPPPDVIAVERADEPTWTVPPGIGSGVLISADGKVMTAAHIVQAADRVVVEFTEGKEIPAEVIASVITADVALLKLEWVPADAVVARLGDSDNAEE